MVRITETKLLNFCNWGINTINSESAFSIVEGKIELLHEKISKDVL